MTPQERAEKICKNLRDFGDPSKSNWLKEEIAAEIEEAYAEGFRAGAEDESENVQNNYDFTYDEGFNAAREKAKKIAGDIHVGNHSQYQCCEIARHIGEMEP